MGGSCLSVLWLVSPPTPPNCLDSAESEYVARLWFKVSALSLKMNSYYPARRMPEAVLRVCVCVCVYVCMHVCMYEHTYVCVYVCRYVGR